MRAMGAILLMGWLTLPLHGQGADLVLPDTTLSVASPGELRAAVARRLAREGLRGDLGTVYHLQTLGWKPGRDGNLRLVFNKADTEVPPPDTVIVRDVTGRMLPNLSTILGAADPRTGSILSSSGQPALRVSQRAYYRHRAGYGVLYEVQDVSQKRLQLLAAYDRPAGQPGQMVGEVMMDLPNLFGTLRYLHLELRRLSPATQTLNLIYAEPRLPLLPLGGQIKFLQDLRDTLYVQRDLKLQLTSPPGPGWNWAAGIGQRELWVSSRGREQGLVPYRQRNMNLSVYRQTYDEPFNPREGYRITLDLEGGTLTGAQIDPQATLSRGKLQVEWVTSRASLTLAQQVQTLALFATGYDPQPADMGRFGGSASLRGYREDQFLAPWGVVSRTELRYRTGAITRLHLFADLATLPGREVLAAAGVGLVLRAGQNLIQLDFAWNRDDDFRSGKVHLRVVNFLSMQQDYK